MQNVMQQRATDWIAFLRRLAPDAKAAVERNEAPQLRKEQVPDMTTEEARRLCYCTLAIWKNWTAGQTLDVPAALTPKCTPLLMVGLVLAEETILLVSVTALSIVVVDYPPFAERLESELTQRFDLLSTRLDARQEVALAN